MSIADRIRVEDVRLLSDDWYVLRKTTLSYRRNDGTWQRQSRETYDRETAPRSFSTIPTVRRF